MYGIFTYIYHKKSTIHVGKYTSPMDPMGKGISTMTVHQSHPPVFSNHPNHISAPGCGRCQVLKSSMPWSGEKRQQQKSAFFWSSIRKAFFGEHLWCLNSDVIPWNHEFMIVILVSFQDMGFSENSIFHICGSTSIMNCFRKPKANSFGPWEFVGLTFLEKSSYRYLDGLMKIKCNFPKIWRILTLGFQVYH